MVIALKEREGNKNKSTGAMNIWVPVRKKKKEKKQKKKRESKPSTGKHIMYA
jgi:hypothetical protein